MTTRQFWFSKPVAIKMKLAKRKVIPGEAMQVYSKTRVATCRLLSPTTGHRRKLL